MVLLVVSGFLCEGLHGFKVSPFDGTVQGATSTMAWNMAKWLVSDLMRFDAGNLVGGGIMFAVAFLPQQRQRVI